MPARRQDGAIGCLIMQDGGLYGMMNCHRLTGWLALALSRELLDHIGHVCVIEGYRSLVMKASLLHNLYYIALGSGADV